MSTFEQLLNILNALLVHKSFNVDARVTVWSLIFLLNDSKVSAIIREKILMNYDKEIPYSVEVAVEEFKEEGNLLRISAVIFCERDSQKGILIGKQGAALRTVGTQARKDIEAFFDKKVFLQLFVKVEKDWRNRERKLRNFGYQLEHKND